jgi:uncharacterized protein YciI
MKSITMILLLIMALHANAQQTTTLLNESSEMKVYQLVFLKAGPNRNQDSATAAGIQQEHLRYLTSMYEKGYADILGPFVENQQIRGIVIYNVSTPEEARKLAEADPAVKAGRLIVEVHPWYSLKGSMLR